MNPRKSPEMVSMNAVQVTEVMSTSGRWRRSLMSSVKEMMRSRTLSQSMGFGQSRAWPRARRSGSEVWTRIASQICKSIQWWPFACAPLFLVSLFFCIRRSKIDFEGVWRWLIFTEKTVPFPLHFVIQVQHSRQPSFSVKSGLKNINQILTKRYLPVFLMVSCSRLISFPPTAKRIC